MAYIPTEWFNGDTITAEKLNNIENGIEKINNSIDSTKLGTESNKSIFVSSSSSDNPYGEWKTIKEALKVGLSPEENFSDESGGTIGFFGYTKDDKIFEWFNSRDLVNSIASFLPSMPTSSLISLAKALGPYLPLMSESSLISLAGALAPYISLSSSSE